MLSSPSLEADLQVTSAESLVHPHHTIEPKGKVYCSSPKVLVQTSRNPGVPVPSGGIARLWKMGTGTELH
jgi:hypothetical protein